MGTQIHGRNAYVSLGGTEISGQIKSTETPREKDTHDVTTYGNDDKYYLDGLRDATVSHDIVYDADATTGTVDVIEAAYLATGNVAWVFRPEGTGTGKPEYTANVIVTNWTATTPVGGEITGALELQVSGGVTKSTQS